MKLGRSPIIIAAAIASAGVLAFTSVGPAAALDQVGTGTPTCSAGYTGAFKFSPALVAGGTATSELVQVQAKFKGCSGGTPIPASGSYVAKGVLTGTAANDCATWFGAPSSSPTYKTNVFNLIGNVTWTSSPAISGSHVTFPSMRVKTGTGGRITVQLPAPPGSGTVTGSYATTTASQLTLMIPNSYAAISTECSSPGVAGLHIVQTTSAGSSSGTW